MVKTIRKILLDHGLVRTRYTSKNIDALLKSGYSTISFDAPAHGKSLGIRLY
jgi:alpha-beta hydrolase superfamily lysophospholipase